jgi:hypothetical protein
MFSYSLRLCFVFFSFSLLFLFFSSESLVFYVVGACKFASGSSSGSLAVGIHCILRGRRLEIRFWLEFWEPCGWHVGIPRVLRGRRLQIRFWLEFWKPCCRNPSYFTWSAFGNQLLARVLGALMSKSLVFYEVGACNRTWGSIWGSLGGRSFYIFLIFRYIFIYVISTLFSMPKRGHFVTPLKCILGCFSAPFCRCVFAASFRAACEPKSDPFATARGSKIVLSPARRANFTK